MSSPNRPVSPALRLLSASLFVRAGASFIIAGAGVVAWNAIGHVPHGWWLASFLALVGGIAQLLLGTGHRELSAQTPAGEARCSAARPLVVWNIGTLLVPLGVLAEARAAVVVGSVALLAALGGLSLVLRGSSHLVARQFGHPHAAYLALMSFLTASVLVGTGLAWDLPWL